MQLWDMRDGRVVEERYRTSASCAPRESDRDDIFAFQSVFVYWVECRCMSCECAYPTANLWGANVLDPNLRKSRVALRLKSVRTEPTLFKPRVPAEGAEGHRDVR